mgnify:CR=1 FL=1
MHEDITVEHVQRDGCPKWNCLLVETQLTHLSWINESISYQTSVITSGRHTTVLEAALLPAKPSWCSRSIYLSAKLTFALHVSLCKTWQLAKGDNTTSNASQWKAELRICRQHEFNSTNKMSGAQSCHIISAMAHFGILI